MEVPDPERITRFIFSSGHYNTTRVKPDAFICAPHQECSVSCTEGLEEVTIWELGRQTAEARSDAPTLRARADLRAGDVRLAQLIVDRDDNPKYHANITGWDGNTRLAQKQKALLLAAAGPPKFPQQQSPSAL